MKLEKGQLVELDGIIAVVIGTPEDTNVPEDHVLLWFGEPQAKRISEGGEGNPIAITYTVPAGLCKVIENFEIIH